MTKTNQNLADLMILAHSSTLLASTCAPHQCDPSSAYFRALEMRTFAALLLNECLSFIEPMPGSGDSDDIALNSATVAIKEHFGIDLT